MEVDPSDPGQPSLRAVFWSRSKRRRVMLFGLVGGPISGVALSLCIVIPAAIRGAIEDPASLPGSVIFAVMTGLIGALVGLIGGLACSGSVVATMASTARARRWISSLAIAFIAAAVASLVSFLLVAPILSLNPVLTMLIIAPVAGFVYYWITSRK